MTKKSLILLLLLYIGATGITYGALKLMHKSGTTAGTSSTANVANAPEAKDQNENPIGQLIAIDPKAARNQQCPLSGKMYTQAEKDAWSKRRPLAVMIENSPDARPQSGLSNADLVFEAMAEGGVTRFMAFFYCDVQANDTILAPVRSARMYFVNLAEGFDRPLYVHVGGANTPGPADALGKLSDMGWNGANDMNQFSIGYPTFVRDYNRTGKDDLATEHTMITSTEKLWAVADKRGWTNIAPGVSVPTGLTKLMPSKKVAATTNTNANAGVGADWQTQYTPWAFQDGTPNQGNVSTISFDFWDGFDQYGVRWEYNGSTNSYKRVLAGQPHIDLNNKKQIEAKNAVVMFAIEKGPIDEKKHMLYTVTGTGDALVFQNGAVIKATWSKPTETSELTFADASGKPLQFVRGLTWISIVSPKTKITY